MAQPVTFEREYPDSLDHSSGKKFKGILKSLPFKLPASGTISASGSGGLLFSATVRKGKLNGTWQSWYSNGMVCDSGRLVNNLPDGKWIYRNETGEIQSIRHYSADKFVRITGEMQQYHPKHSFFFLSELYQRNRGAALQCLDAAYSFPDSRMRKSVSTLTQLAEGNTGPAGPYKPVFVQCVHDGLFLNYFPGGIARDSGIFKDGLRSGKWIHRDSAQAGWYQGAYKHGIQVKEWKQFDEEGRLVEIFFYDQSGRISWRKKINRQPSR